MSDYIFYASYLGTIVGQIWLLCYYGQKLIDSSADLAEGIYESDWMDLDNNLLRKQIILIMLRVQRLQRLTAKNFAVISFETFATVKYLFLF